MELKEDEPFPEFRLPDNQNINQNVNFAQSTSWFTGNRTILHKAIQLLGCRAQRHNKASAIFTEARFCEGSVCGYGKFYRSTARWLGKKVTDFAPTFLCYSQSITSQKSKDGATWEPDRVFKRTENTTDIQRMRNSKLKTC
jgi:hypothetical protein